MHNAFRLENIKDTGMWKLTLIELAANGSMAPTLLFDPESLFYTGDDWQFILSFE